MATSLIRSFLLFSIVPLLSACQESSPDTPPLTTTDPAPASTFEVLAWEQPDEAGELVWGRVAGERMARFDYEGAIEAFQKLAEMDPDKPGNYIGQAIAYGQLGNGTKVQELVETAVRVATETADPELEDFRRWQQHLEQFGFDPEDPMGVEAYAASIKE